MSWKEGDFKRWPGDAVFVGGKGVKRLHSIFASIPTLLYKKVLLIFSGKGGPDTALKKILQNRQIQNILMTWTAQCVRLYGLQEYDFRTPSCVHFGVLSCSPLRDVKTLGFLKEHHSRTQIWGSNLSDKGVCLILRVFYLSIYLSIYLSFYLPISFLSYLSYLSNLSNLSNLSI